MPKRSQLHSQHFRDYETQLSRQIGARIRERRDKLGLTQEALRIKMELENVSITKSQLSRVEKGERLPNAAVIIALAKVLHTPVGWLLQGTDRGSEL